MLHAGWRPSPNKQAPHTFLIDTPFHPVHEKSAVFRTEAFRQCPLSVSSRTTGNGKTTAVYCNVKKNKTVCKFIVAGLESLLTAEEGHRLCIAGD